MCKKIKMINLKILLSICIITVFFIGLFCGIMVGTKYQKLVDDKSLICEEYNTTIYYSLSQEDMAKIYMEKQK
jgi:hypothetical protein